MRLTLRSLIALAAVLVGFTAPAHSDTTAEEVRVGIIINPYAGDRAGPEQDEDAAAMLRGGLPELIVAAGARLEDIRTVKLSAEDEKAYGRWNRFGLASGHLADMASANAAAGVRDTDPLEQARIEADGIPQVSTEDVRRLSANLRGQMQRLSELSDIVYVHVDLDVLDPAEVSGHPLTVPNGPTGAELGEAIRIMFEYPKTHALGIASYPHTDDPGQLTLKAIHRLVEAAIRGLQKRATAPSAD